MTRVKKEEEGLQKGLPLSEEERYCPECGAGKNPDGSFRIRKDYPIIGQCNTCDEKTAEAMRKFGSDIATRREENVLKTVLPHPHIETLYFCPEIVRPITRVEVRKVTLLSNLKFDFSWDTRMTTIHDLLMAGF